jgi:hypothetical protein
MRHHLLAIRSAVRGELDLGSLCPRVQDLERWFDRVRRDAFHSERVLAVGRVHYDFGNNTNNHWMCGNDDYLQALTGFSPESDHGPTVLEKR